MQFSTLTLRSLGHFWRTNVAVVLGVATAVAVVAGALVVGDSVRGSLRDLAARRLGRTDFAVSSTTSFFREVLAEEMRSRPDFGRKFESVCPMIAVQGFVTGPDNRRASGVQVYGVDERFWQFHGRPETTSEGASVSIALASELRIKQGDSLLITVQKPTDIPIESMHGRKDEVARSMRLTASRVLADSDLGEFSLRPQQGAVRTVFIPLPRLQRDLERPGKVNTILISTRTTELAPDDAVRTLDSLLSETCRLDDLGLKLRVLSAQGSIALESDSAIIDDSTSKTAIGVAERPPDGTSRTRPALKPSPVLTYLANTIRSGGREVPYSLITAVDKSTFDELRRSEGSRNESGTATSGGYSTDPPILLNQWAASDLHAIPGAQVEIEYYVWKDEGRLATEKSHFRLDDVLRIDGLASDRDLAPEYPGITESESLTDWNPPFPMDLGRVRKIDEDYWHRYRTTPKAFIRLEDGQRIWKSRFGSLTSIRLMTPAGSNLQAAAADYEKDLRAALDPGSLGIAAYPVRAEGLEASRGATDFGEYFLYFSFFLLVSAVLITGLFFRLGIEQRIREIGVLRAVGFPVSAVRGLFLREGLILSLFGSLAGLGGAIGYSELMMWGLRTWWVGAVGTTLLTLHVSPISLAAGAIAGVLTSVAAIAWTIRGVARALPRTLVTGAWYEEQSSGTDTKQVKTNRSARLVAVATLTFGFLFIAGALAAVIGQVAGFFAAGTLFLLAMSAYSLHRLRTRQTSLIRGTGWTAVARLGFRNARHRPARSMLCISLLASAVFVIVAVDAFRASGGSDARDPKSGTGGFPLIAESMLPIADNPNTPEGAENLNLVWQGDTSLKDVRFWRFRVRQGDDTSCLNLYLPRNPRILAPTTDFIDAGRFGFQGSIATTAAERANPWRLLEREEPDGVVPVIADANSITYVLHATLGGNFLLSRNGDNPVTLRIVAALRDSVFQSELLMSEANFLKLFPNEQGYRFFLIDAPQETDSRVTALLEDRLSDFGFDVVESEERLAAFHTVENTYISTFQALGGLGLLLGTVGLGAILLRNVMERRRELALLRAVGYNATHFALSVLAENALLLAAGLSIGVISAGLAVTPALLSRRTLPVSLSLGTIIAGVLLTGIISSIAATVAAVRSPLVEALKSE